MNVYKPSSYKTIWLNTENATASTDRKIFTFNNMPLIQIRGKSILKINSINLSGPGLANAKDQNWTLKLKNIKHTQNSYYNSDRDPDLTISNFNYNPSSVQNGLLSIELVEQDINNFSLSISSSENHGAVQSGSNVNFHVGICIHEFYE